MTIWPDFSGHWGVLVLCLWFFLMHINFACLSHFYFLKIIRLPNLKNCWQLLINIRLVWPFRIILGEKEENISCSPVEALYGDTRCSSLHLKFRCDDFQTVAFLEASLTCQREAYRLETIYWGNLKCYWKYSCKMSSYLHAGELDVLKNFVILALCLFSLPRDLEKYHERNTMCSLPVCVQ